MQRKWRKNRINTKSLLHSSLIFGSCTSSPNAHFKPKALGNESCLCSKPHSQFSGSHLWMYQESGHILLNHVTLSSPGHSPRATRGSHLAMFKTNFLCWCPEWGLVVKAISSPYEVLSAFLQKDPQTLSLSGKKKNACNGQPSSQPLTSLFHPWETWPASMLTSQYRSPKGLWRQDSSQWEEWGFRRKQGWVRPMTNLHNSHHLFPHL